MEQGTCCCFLTQADCQDSLGLVTDGENLKKKKKTTIQISQRFRQIPFLLILSIAPGPVPTRMEGHHVLGARQTFQRFCSACFQLLFQSSCQTWFNQVATEKSMWPGAMARKGNSSTGARARRKDVGMCPGIVPGTRMCSSTRLLDMQNSRAWK